MDEEKDKKIDYNRIILSINCILFFAIFVSIVWFYLELHQIKANGVDYVDFMTRYYEVQSNWLNVGLFALAIVLAVIGVIIPIFTLKFYDSKKAEMDAIINKAKNEAKELENFIREEQAKTDDTAKIIEKAQKQADATTVILADAQANAERAIKEIKSEVESSQNQMRIDLDEMKASVYKIEESVKQAKESENIAKANEFSTLGYSALSQKDYVKSIEYYSKSLDLHKTAVTYLNRGVSYFKSEKDKNAIEDYTNAIELLPDYALAYLNRAIAYKKTKQHDKAIIDFNKVIELNPQDKKAYYWRGNTYFDMKEYDNAFNDYSITIGLDPKYDAAYGMRGVIYSNRKDYSKAIDEYKNAIKFDENNLIPYYNLTEAYILSFDFKNGLEILNLFIQKEPEPYIFEDDYDNWMEALNQHSGEDFVEEIKDFINNKLTKKPRD